MVTASLTFSRARLCALAVGLSYALFLIYTFVPFRPFDDADIATRVEGSPLDRVFVFAMGAVAVAVIALRLPRALMMLRQSALVWLLTGWCLLSILWSQFPDLTLRRMILFLILNLTAFAIAVGADRLYRLHVILTVFLAAVVLLNLLSAVAMPGLAFTELGLRGIYPQKNVAGMVGMISAFATLTWMFGVRRPLPLLLALAFLAIDLVFLVLTKSKTSLLLGFGAGVLVPMLALLVAHSSLQRQLVAFGVPLLAVVAGVVMALSNLSREELLTLLVGDPTFTGRTIIWEFAWGEILQRPWLGSGYGAFWDVGDANDPLLRARPGTFLSEVDPGVINQAHNGFLEIWLQVGLPALLLAGAIVLQSLGQAFRLSTAPGVPRRERGYYTFLLLIMLVYLLSNATEATLFIRGQLLNNVATLVIFLLHRLVLEERIAARLARAAPRAAEPVSSTRSAGRALPAGPAEA